MVAYQFPGNDRSHCTKMNTSYSELVPKDSMFVGYRSSISGSKIPRDTNLGWARLGCHFFCRSVLRVWMLGVLALGVLLGVLLHKAFALGIGKFRAKKIEPKPCFTEYDLLDLTEVWLIRHGETESNAERRYFFIPLRSYFSPSTEFALDGFGRFRAAYVSQVARTERHAIE